MKKILITYLFSTLISVANGQSEWQAGTARINITPAGKVWMGGYAARTRPGEGTLNNLWAKALVLQDARGNKAVLVTADLVGFTKDVSDPIRQQLEALSFSKAQIILNASHTHSGPLLKINHVHAYPLDSAQRRRNVQYLGELQNKIVQVVKDALKEMTPVRLHAANGVTRFQVNRRNNSENGLLQQSELKGPNDFAVPVIKVTDRNNKVKALVFGYACHPTVLGGYEWSSDYPGFAQSALEKTFPGTMALFFQGAGGDQNPLPRRTVPLAKQYGQQLAAAVERVLEEPMEELSPALQYAYTEINLRFAPPMKEDELKKLAQESGSYIKKWAESLLEKRINQIPVITSYPYPVQAWKLGELPLIALGGEVTVEYALKLKKMFGQKTFVMGYSNDVMGYIPTLKILKEGGYEGLTSQMSGTMPGPWNDDIEETILETSSRIATQAGISPAP